MRRSLFIEDLLPRKDFEMKRMVLFFAVATASAVFADVCSVENDLTRFASLGSVRRCFREPSLHGTLVTALMSVGIRSHGHSLTVGHVSAHAL